MASFKKYATQADEMAKAAFNEYRKAEERYKRAESRRNPRNTGQPQYEYQAEKAKAEAEYYAAKEELTKAKGVLAAKQREIKDIRKELAAAVNDAYAARAEDVDGDTMTLLNSGILKPYEYKRLADRATSPTMKRIIGQYASQASEKAKGDEATALRVLAAEAAQNDGSEYLQYFDVITNVYDRTVNNPGLIDHWDDLTGNMIEQF